VIMSDNDSIMARELHGAFQQVAPDLGFSYEPWGEMPDLERRLAVRACWQATQRRQFLEGLLEEADLEAVKRALAREQVIRDAMAETGESREIVAEMVDAHTSMDQEAVLDLTEGEPTTLRDGLEQFVAELERRMEGDPGSTFGEVLDGLNALLSYPWPGPEGGISGEVER
jgi:hypothetical protein